MTKEEFDKLWARLPEREEMVLLTKFGIYCNFHKDIVPLKDCTAYNVGYRIGYRDGVDKPCNLFYTRLVTSNELYPNNDFRLDVFHRGYNDGFERGKENKELYNSLFNNNPLCYYRWDPMRSKHPIDWKVKPEDHMKHYCAADCSATASLYDRLRKDMKEMSNTITNIIYNPPATIIFFGDNSKSVVKCRKDEKYDATKGVAMAIYKHFKKDSLGHHWYDIFKVVDHQTVDGTDIEKELAIYAINASFKRELNLYKKDHSVFKNLDAILKEFPYVPQEEKREAADIIEKKSKEASTIEITIDEETGLNRVEEIAKSAAKEEKLQEGNTEELPISELVTIPESDKIDYQRIFDLYEAGYTADDIAEAMNINVPTVCRSLHMIYPECLLGEIRRDENKKTYSNSAYKRKINNKQIKECYEADMSFNETCEYLNLKAVTLGKLEHTIYGKQVFRRE